MSQRITTTDLISEIRGQLNEENRKTVRDDLDIIPALNRAQNKAVGILARVYKEPLLHSALIATVAGQDLYPIPEDALEQRLLKIETKRNQVYQDVKYISYLDASNYEVANRKTSVPLYYTIVGQDYKIIPSSNGIYPLRVWYLRDPAPIGTVQGRINTVNTAGNYIRVDAVGTDLTSVSDSLNSFVNIVDGATGIIKATMQIQSISGTKITFLTIPTRPTVWDAEIDTSLASPISGLTISLDDYICLAPTSCVPFLKKPLANFLIQYSVAELTRKLGGDFASEKQVLDDFETELKQSYVARPNNIRVRRRLAIWGSRQYITPTTDGDA